MPRDADRDARGPRRGNRTRAHDGPAENRYGHGPLLRHDEAEWLPTARRTG
ncbi:hypothetical protein [Streptomyces abyssalis]|uniref:hypothetical protein n=1 Tax=Streptomyces abyssalis TaxID=933944 RepID=UPI001C0B1E20|nr:hypothetical protein [Streptomyces abyssalis]